MEKSRSEEDSLVEKLFRPIPLHSEFRRVKPSAFRFQPYSQKIGRRLDIYTPILYDLWVGMEWDTKVNSFNERVEKCPIAGGDGKIFYWTPPLVSISDQVDYWVHLIRFNDDEDVELADDERESYIQTWVHANRLKLKIWTPGEIRLNQIELDNRKQLYAYLNNPEIVISPALREMVLLVLRRHRKTTLDDLIATLSNECVDSVIQVVADLIRIRTIFSDIHKYPFGWSSEISCFHEIP